jgi:Arc/MetJ-type ribon-helix-helix transcriptional regulator
MKRTTVTLPDDLAGALEREARRRRLSVSQVTREALAAHLGLDGDEPRRLPFAALGASGHRTTGRDLEELLAAEWTRARRR